MKRMRNRVIGLIAIVVCIAGMLIYQNAQSDAAFDTSKAITFEQYSSRNTIDNSTLFIGTYLIYMNSMTDELYNMAIESQAESMQYDIYYKSELANGAWFEISNATGMYDIAESGTVAKAEEMNPLWITYVVGKDGAVRDARTMNPANPYDDPSPYDLYTLPELEEVKNAYEKLRDDENAKGKSDELYRYLLSSFLGTHYKTGTTDALDKKMDKLFKLYNDYLGAGKDKEAAIVFELMGRVDATRRAEVMNWIGGAAEGEPGYAEPCALDYFLSKMGTDFFRQTYYPDWDDDDGEKPAPELISNSQVDTAMGNAQSKVLDRYRELVTKQLSDGDTVLKHAEYDYSNQAIDAADGGMSNRMDTILSKLQFVYNIEDGVIDDQDGELNLIETELLPAAQENYIAAIGSGESGEYKAGVNNQYPSGVLKQLLEDTKLEVEEKRSDLQLMISSKTERMDSADAVEFTYGRIELTNSWRGNIKSDAFKTKAGETVDDHIEWLKQLAESIINGDASLKSELDKLKEKKDSLLTAKQEALDDNDRNKAAKVDAMIAELDKQIAAKEGELEDAMKNGDASAAVDMRNSQTAAGNNDKMLQDAKDALAEGNLDDAMAAIDALAENGATDALDALADAAAAGSADDALKNALDQAMDKAEQVQADTGLGTGNSTETGMTEDGLLDLLADLLGGSFDELDAKGKVIAASAMSRLGKEGYTPATRLGKNMIQTCQKEGNRYVYAQYQADPSHEYISLYALSYVTDYRYAYSTSKQEGSLAQKDRVYKFKVNSRTLTLANNATKDLQHKVGYQPNYPYAATSDLESIFGCVSEYIKDTKVAACLTESMSSKADEIVDAAKEMFAPKGDES